VLEGGDEREFHGLALLIASLRRRIPIPEPDLLIGVGLDPH
jgi:hypothetical protein